MTSLENMTMEEFAKYVVGGSWLLSSNPQICANLEAELLRRLGASGVPRVDDKEINATLQDLASCFADDRNPAMSERTRQMCQDASLIIVGLYAEMKRLREEAGASGVDVEGLTEITHDLRESLAQAIQMQKSLLNSYIHDVLLKLEGLAPAPKDCPLSEDCGQQAVTPEGHKAGAEQPQTVDRSWSLPILENLDASSDGPQAEKGGDSWLGTKQWPTSKSFHAGEPVAQSGAGGPIIERVIASLRRIQEEARTINLDEVERLLKPEPATGQVGAEQVAIDIANLRFYAEMADKFNWETDIIHKSVIIQTLNEIAERVKRTAHVIKEGRSEE